MKIKLFFKRVFNLFLTFLFFIGSGGLKPTPNLDDPTLKAPQWPKWVHEHWVWENVGTEDTARSS